MIKINKSLFFVFLLGIAVARQVNAQTTGFQNPVVSGMNPDPSICRVGEDYYLVTSSFLWYPGLPIYHSKDLINWNMIGYGLNRKSQLDLSKGSGIYAPTLRYNKGTFYLITTNQRNGGNFIVTAKKPSGPWSDPTWVKELNGIDPSLFFDEDGKVYFTSTHPDGIVQAEIDVNTGKLTTSPKIIWTGTGGRYPEGPHLYKINGYYYLLISEGGTEYGHQAVIARSKTPWGPFESNPSNPILTHKNKNAQGNPIQGTGHADFVQDTDGNWWTVLLAFRQRGSHHHIGRETFLAPLVWDKNDWPVINKNGTVDLKMDVKTLPQVKVFDIPEREAFDQDRWSLRWNFIRNPDSNAYSLAQKKEWLTLNGASSSLSTGNQPTFLGFRQKDLSFTAETQLDFTPVNVNEEAGLSIYHRPEGHYDLFQKTDGKNYFIVLRYTLGSLHQELASLKCDGSNNRLRVQSDGQFYTFSYSSADNTNYQTLGRLETKFISSETIGGFVGAYIGLYATGNGKKSAAKAYFKWMDYKRITDTP